ncbi:hypothetical protein HRbin02_01741 [Candidatus Calditenuaceae archaeon HR02]|nr:hypothetical protein HRbin02_01741 [Candidatus Calditenuaceae archaeon HR02]
MRFKSLPSLRERVRRELERRVEKARIYPTLLNSCEDIALRLRLIDYLLERGYSEGLDSHPPYLLDDAAHPYPDEVLKTLSDVKQFIERTDSYHLVRVYYHGGLYLVWFWHLGVWFCLPVRCEAPEPFPRRGERKGDTTILTGGEFLEEVGEINSYVDRANSYGLDFKPVSHKLEASERVYITPQHKLIRDPETGLERLDNSPLLIPIKAENLTTYIRYTILREAGEDEVEEARERARRREELDSRIAGLARGSEPLVDDGYASLYRLGKDGLQIFLGDGVAEKVGGLGEFLLLIHGSRNIYRDTSISASMPARILACLRILEDMRVFRSPVVKVKSLRKAPRYLIRLDQGYSSALKRNYELLLNPSQECVEMARKARILYEDGKLVLIDDEAVEELMASQVFKRGQ